MQERRNSKVGPYRYWVDELDDKDRHRLMGRPHLCCDESLRTYQYFGFPTKRALYTWFTRKDLIRLRLSGFVIAKYKVKRDYMIIDRRPKPTQVAFVLERAELLEAA